MRYIFDTSALSALVNHESRSQYCSLIIELIESGKVVIIKLVYGEAQHVAPEIYENLNSIRKLVRDSESDEVWLEAGRITMTHRHMSRPRFNKRKIADPWIVAHAKINGYTVVTNESRKRNRQMPDVCDKEGISVMTLDELYNKYKDL